MLCLYAISMITLCAMNELSLHAYGERRGSESTVAVQLQLIMANAGYLHRFARLIALPRYFYALLALQGMSCNILFQRLFCLLSLLLESNRNDRMERIYFALIFSPRIAH